MSKDGGPAFPEVSSDFNGERGLISVYSYGGMTLRDYFAAKAMQSELATNGVPGPACDALVDAAAKAGHDPVYHMAVCAYEMADAMLKARDE